MLSEQTPIADMSYWLSIAIDNGARATFEIAALVILAGVTLHWFNKLKRSATK